MCLEVQKLWGKWVVLGFQSGKSGCNWVSRGLGKSGGQGVSREFSKGSWGSQGLNVCLEVQGSLGLGGVLVVQSGKSGNSGCHWVSGGSGKFGGQRVSWEFIQESQGVNGYLEVQGSLGGKTVSSEFSQGG